MAVTITWTGHSTFLVDTGEGVLLVDPFLDDCPTCPIESSGVHCDAILITHGHFDHVADAVSVANSFGLHNTCAPHILDSSAISSSSVLTHVSDTLDFIDANIQ